MELMERLAGYTLVGFRVKGYPVTDKLLAPFAGHKSMVNFGAENGALTDACFPIFSAMFKLRYLLLDRNAAIHGNGLSALQSCKLDLLTLSRTGPGEDAQAQALDVVAAYTQAFNKMGFIETRERDEIYRTLRGILDTLPDGTLPKDTLIEKFEELRDF